MGNQIDDNYLAKINRNEFVVPNAPKDIKKECINNILICKNMASKIAASKVDSKQEIECIQTINQMLDDDYVKMGYTLPPKSEGKYVYSRKRGHR